MDKVVPLTSGVPRRDLALGGLSLLNPSPTQGVSAKQRSFPRDRLDSLDSEHETASQGTLCILGTFAVTPAPLDITTGVEAGWRIKKLS